MRADDARRARSAAASSLRQGRPRLQNLDASRDADL